MDSILSSSDVYRVQKGCWSSVFGQKSPFFHEFAGVRPGKGWCVGRIIVQDSA